MLFGYLASMNLWMKFGDSYSEGTGEVRLVLSFSLQIKLCKWTGEPVEMEVNMLFAWRLYRLQSEFWAECYEMLSYWKQ